LNQVLKREAILLDVSDVPDYRFELPLNPYWDLTSSWGFS
jgi:hypothetical protein